MLWNYWVKIGRRRETAEKVVRAVWVLFMCAVLCVGLCSCGEKYKSAAEAFGVFADAYGSLPAGKLYLSEAKEWEKEYLSDDIVYSLYANIKGECEYDHVAECAIYLSSSIDEFYEVAVFICYDNSGVEEVAKMCHRRIDIAKRLHTLVDTEAIENSRVEIHGNTVIMSVLPDKEKTARAHRAVGR